jgi:hypothetical protein
MALDYGACRDRTLVVNTPAPGAEVELVPRIGAGRTHRFLLTKLRVVIHDFTHQLFDHILAERSIPAARQFRHGLGNGGNDLVRVERVRLTCGGGVLCKKVLDQIDNQAMQAWPFFGLVLII